MITDPVTQPADGLPLEWARFVSPDVGVVHRLDPGLAGYDHPRLASTYATVCDAAPVLGAGIEARAGGVGPDRTSATRAALGEAVERYSAAYVPRSRCRRARAHDLTDRPLVAPSWLDAADGDEPVDWVPGHRLTVGGPGEPAWVASSRVYLAPPSEGGRVAPPTSTGLAAHPDPWRALASGLLEVIERDAVMTTWLRRLPPEPLATGLRWSTRAGEVRFDRAIEQYLLLRLPSPVDVPVVLGVALGAEGQPPVAVGAAADLDLARAARRALVETRQTFAWAEHMLAARRVPPSDANAITDLEEHVAYYLDPTRRDAFDFLIAGGRRARRVDLAAAPPPGDARSVATEVVRRLHAARCTAYAVDATAPDVRSLDWWVVRAVVPELYPLLVGRQAPEHPRVPRALAAARDPHPFP